MSAAVSASRAISLSLKETGLHGVNRQVGPTLRPEKRMGKAAAALKPARWAASRHKAMMRGSAA